MKLTHALVLLLSLVVIFRCHPSKKTTSTTPPPAPVANAEPVTIGPKASFLATPSSKTGPGVFAPGEDELIAIHKTYKEVEMQTLTDGFNIYTGKCTNCHGAENIYNYSNEKWKDIIDDMSFRAVISSVEKDAVYKYVLSVKATQPEKQNK